MMKVRTVGAALAALALAACGSKPAAQADNAGAAPTDTMKTNAAPAKTADFDPCAVLTPADVTAVTTDKVASTSRNDHDCTYVSRVDEDDGVQISIYPTGGADQMGSIRDANKLLGGIGDAVSGQADVGKDVQAAITPPAAGGAPAIGDEAVWEPNEVLAVRKGDAFVQVTPPIMHTSANRPSYALVSSAERKAIAQKLAAAVLAKIAP